MRDILRQPAELQRTISHLTGAGRVSLLEAAGMIQRAREVFVTGIGASWHAALGAGTLFSLHGRPVYTVEAGELLHFTSIPSKAVVIAISRTGRSIEIVQLLSTIRASGASLIGITNSPESPLATEAEASIVIPVVLDYAISVNTYSTLALAAGVLADFASGDVDALDFSLLSRALTEVETRLQGWREQIKATTWLEPQRPYYFLARGPSLASCHQSRLLWEEGAKSPATAMNTSGFRHGPQETVRAGMRFGIFIDPLKMRAQDLAVADDLRSLGASVMLIGQRIPEGNGHLVFQLPELPPNWQFAVDIIPAQLAAEQLARLAGVDCDSFRVCSYIVEDEHGLLKKP
ncbi:MAG: SIS domain-containing protein [Acidobacteriia bacterium]|nr:SIS domain-containing protein [Terriglobia bacterium]